jgi:hypothetical protein
MHFKKKIVRLQQKSKASATIVTDGKFYRKILYTNGYEMLLYLRLTETGKRTVVNRMIQLNDDGIYGHSILPDHEFNQYSSICARRSCKSTVLSTVPFIDEFHSRLFNKDQILHGPTSLLYPRLS